MVQKNTILCSAFPGTGKSFLFKNSDKVVLDSDSSTFDKADFPRNYIEHIKENIGKADIICISSHKEVRDALFNEGLHFTLIYPSFVLKAEYMDRYRWRGSPDGFIKLINTNWDIWLEELKNQEGCEHLVLGEGQYISDVFKDKQELIHSEHLQFIHDRIINIYGEQEDVDFLVKLREVIAHEKEVEDGFEKYMEFRNKKNENEKK